MKQLTPVIVVDAIEPVLPFWRDRLGFTVTAEVPHEDRRGNSFPVSRFPKLGMWKRRCP